MACVNGDGTLTQSAKSVLSSLDNKPMSAEQLSQLISVPLFKVRSSLRDMKSMGLVKMTNDEHYEVTEGGRKLLSR
ncbi:hypothetical protein [Salipaludibacillus daqingensis]|uniref:hypothetical protein n=1 Tax=Salipaludibacillus daqingensis TaxID=3041001 RepID=UPI0024755BFB|nr:hypothetical protein [Salipaludibacillus daqingensis]